MKLRFLFLILFTTSLVTSVQVRLSGHAKDYANHVLIIKHASNFITNETSEVERFLIDKSGNFDIELPLTKTQKITLELGKINGEIYVKPKTEYKLVLLPYSPLSQEEKINPFFKPEIISIGILKDSTNFNETIEQFNLTFNSLTYNKIQSIVIKKNYKEISTIIQKCDSLFPAPKDSWFYNYKFYQYQYLTNLKNYVTLYFLYFKLSFIFMELLIFS
eukprot:GHVL01028358.1.p1 GENE.GHVL01028358.1~~GHVL01028358.1.p1  ORF type:complete len:218 (-),score=0.90 GHVL01028358.1:259-912(-)